METQIVNVKFLALLRMNASEDGNVVVASLVLANLEVNAAKTNHAVNLIVNAPALTVSVLRKNVVKQDSARNK